jgi:hypothetical protein
MLVRMGGKVHIQGAKLLAGIDEIHNEARKDHRALSSKQDSLLILADSIGEKIVLSPRKRATRG